MTSLTQDLLLISHNSYYDKQNYDQENRDDQET